MKTCCGEAFRNYFPLGLVFNFYSIHLFIYFLGVLSLRDLTLKIKSCSELAKTSCSYQSLFWELNQPLSGGKKLKNDQVNQSELLDCFIPAIPLHSVAHQREVVTVLRSAEREKFLMSIKILTLL